MNDQTSGAMIRFGKYTEQRTNGDAFSVFIEPKDGTLWALDPDFSSFCEFCGEVKDIDTTA